MAAQKIRKLFINLVENPLHIADQEFVTEDGTTVTITLEEAMHLVTWRNEHQVIFNNPDRVYEVPDIEPERLQEIFSVCDMSQPWSTREQIQGVLASRAIEFALEEAVTLDKKHWRFVNQIDGMGTFDQLTILSSSDGSLHRILPTHSAQPPLATMHVFRTVQENPLWSTILTISVTDVDVDVLYTALHVLWDKARVKSKLINYTEVQQLGILFVRRPTAALFNEIRLTRKALFHLEQEDLTVEAHLSQIEESDTDE